ncbi:hypothetical protein CR513_06395, partial [Mucuna pruriens]
YPDWCFARQIARPRIERTQTCKEEELGCSDHPGAASDPRYSSHLRYGGDGFAVPLRSCCIILVRLIMVEFLELKQRDDTVADYVSKFEALVQFCPTYEGAVNEEAKCVKFISGLRPEIKQVFNY